MLHWNSYQCKTHRMSVTVLIMECGSWCRDADAGLRTPNWYVGGLTTLELALLAARLCRWWSNGTRLS